MDNPLFLLCGVALCWPAPLPLMLLAYLLTRYNIRLDVAPKARGAGAVRQLSDEI